MSDDESPEVGSALSAVFEHSTRARILEVLIELEEPVIEQDVIDHADISRPSFHDHCEALEEFGLVERTKRNRTVECELTDSEGAELFVELHDHFHWKFNAEDDLDTILTEVHR